MNFDNQYCDKKFSNKDCNTVNGADGRISQESCLNTNRSWSAAIRVYVCELEKIKSNKYHGCTLCANLYTINSNNERKSPYDNSNKVTNEIP
uniref:Uncharacterized protein n=1 Tax=Romanomermis culicivorax TaxID=13658 RepID=A0A915KI39_ROMCU